MMKVLLFFLAILAATILQLLAVSQFMPALDDPSYQDQLIGRLYRSYLLSNYVKRSPSIGLSLAEYMANGGQGQDNLHFIPSGR